MNLRQNQRGIALITTLIMLSVVTVMAVAFLAVSRRERAAVTTSSDRLDARALTEAAYQRAEAEIVSRVLATTNILAYDLVVSTNYQSPFGFLPGNTNIANVSFAYPDGRPVVGDDLFALYRNLQVDARVPVFIVTNVATGAEDFRYFLDFNRNGLFETNGVQVELDQAGRSLGFTNFHIGDPEWIGVLRRPDQPHSGSNLFVGRYAFMVLPLGKSLDLNFIHNHAKRLGLNFDGYLRNQGVGSWELNLAGFLRDLNTNAWNGYEYITNAFSPSRLIAFDHAQTLLGLRYRGSPGSLRTIANLYGTDGSRAYTSDFIDGYSDGPLQFDINPPYTGAGAAIQALDDDDSTRPWPGADNPAQYFDPQELFDTPGSGIFSFTNRLLQAGLGRSTYDRHTFYRLLGQLGTDSVPANRGQIHLNYDNRLDFDPRLVGLTPDPKIGYHATNFVRWTASGFFTNAADQILKTLNPPPGRGVPLLAVTNIPVWPTNEYTPSVHRALQVAANIYDATTNRGTVPYPYFPSVFRPLYTSDGRGVRITGYRDATADAWSQQGWFFGASADSVRFDLDELPLGATPNVVPGGLVSGIPLVLGARKGFPNFNEFEFQTTVVASRKMELVKRSPASPPAFTNQLYVVGITNVMGVEFWNSYQAAYPRALRLFARVSTEMVLSNEVRVLRTYITNYTANIDFPPGSWPGQGFRIPIRTNVAFLPTSAYRLATGQFLPLRNGSVMQSMFEPANGFPIPVWRLNITNRVEAALIDITSDPEYPGGRLVDYVNLDNLNTQIDITRELFGLKDDVGQSSILGSFWQTNRIGGVPEGILNQIQASLGAINVAQWNSASSEPSQGQDKQKSVERFREFLGLTGTSQAASPTLRMQLPFSPGMKLFVNKAWQVNDPLVNRMYWDLEDPARTNNIERLPPLFVVTDERSNLGKINFRYRPWQRNLYSSGDATDFDPAFKDPQVTRSDDWTFPTNALPNVGWLGRIHRGTPWQTLYLKSKPVGFQEWQLWSGHPTRIWPGNLIAPGTQPTNDWRLLDVFTTAINENAARGLLSVNQEGIAGWSALLSGVPVLVPGATNPVPVLVEPNSPALMSIVAGVNATRSTRFGGRYNYLGEVLSAPELSLGSPFFTLGTGPLGTPADPVVERIPQMVMSLLKRDEARMAIYAFGQSLRPAPGSVVTEPGPYFQMPTNYVITGEYVTKTLMRLEGFLENGRLRVQPVIESYNEVPPPE
jgi:hypothetical protein